MTLLCIASAVHQASSRAPARGPATSRQRQPAGQPPAAPAAFQEGPPAPTARVDDALVHAPRLPACSKTVTSGWQHFGISVEADAGAKARAHTHARAPPSSGTRGAGRCRLPYGQPECWSRQWWRGERRIRRCQNAGFMSRSQGTQRCPLQTATIPLQVSVTENTFTGGRASSDSALVVRAERTMRQAGGRRRSRTMAEYG